ncbi:CAP domain-containing protein [Streptomyces sp. KR80]|uniref:CAP domain-containing protein n=1 Tax=Streptomyces sp. KR80 TaxID=3457426 RepID=UPI003FD42554
MPTDRASTPPSRDSDRPDSPTALPSGSRSPTRPAPIPSQRPTTPEESGTGTPQDTGHPSRTPAPEPSRPEKPAPDPTVPGAKTVAESEVLVLVNQERLEAGCRPVRADRKLAGLAEQFSEDMARRGFFDHTDPDGANPWDRAEALDIDGLGGENIARGQQDAEAVMEAWMDSPGHRANILNCEYRTIGIGAHLGDGGPWWTQDFGF